MAVGRGGVDLPALAAHRVDARIEGRARAERGLHGEAAAHGGGGEQVLGLEEAAQRVGGGHLGAVQERQALLGRQGQRLQPGERERLARLQPAAAMARLALAEQHQRHVGERREVARGAHRALGRDQRVNLGVEQRDQRVDDLAADAGEAPRQAIDLEQQDQAHGGVVERLADAGRVRQHQRALQQLEVLARDAGLREQAEAGVDAVDRAVLVDDLAHAGDAALDGRAGLGGEAHAHGFLPGLAQLGEGQAAGLKIQFHVQAPFFDVIIGRSRPFSRALSIAIW